LARGKKSDEILVLVVIVYKINIKVKRDRVANPGSGAFFTPGSGIRDE
jgi:hypothetical protein